MESPREHRKFVLVLAGGVAIAVVLGTATFLFHRQALLEDSLREEQVGEDALRAPRPEPLPEQRKRQLREEAAAPRPGGELSEERKAELRGQNQ